MLADIRYGLRLLLGARSFTTAAVAALALGIGLNVTIFSIVNVLLFKPPPVRDAEELVWIAGMSSRPARRATNLSLPDVADLASRPSAVSSVTAFSDVRLAVRAGRQSTRLHGQIVTGNYFEVLGVASAMGRMLAPEDDRASQGGAVVISHSLWKRFFQAEPAAVGSTIQVNGEPLTIVGVAPRGFTGPDVLSPADLWLPLSLAERVTTIETPRARGTWWLRAIGRLAPGVTREEATAVLRGIAASIAQAEPASHEDFGVAVYPLRGVSPFDRDRLAVMALLPVVPLAVLLIACANVAALLFARAISRAREIGIRVALGAGQGRLFRQFLTESVMLALAGGATSLLISLWAPPLLLRFAGAPLAADPGMDRRVIAFTLCVCLFAAMAFGMWPALRASRARGTSLRGNADAGSGRLARFQRMLVAGQLAVTVVLLMATGVFLQSIARAARTNPGFETADRVTLTMDLGLQRYGNDRSAAFYRRVRERASAIPGIREVTYAAYIPLGDKVLFRPFYPAGRVTDPDARPEVTAVNEVGPRFFETMQLGIRRGRALAEQDFIGTPRVAVINETMAGRLAPGGDAIGRRFSLESADAPQVEVVGVSADTVVDDFGEPPGSMVFVPHAGNAGEVSLLAWTSVPPAAALKALADAVSAEDASIAVFDQQTMGQHVADRMDGERAASRLLAIAGGLATALAAFGLYGTMTFAVSRRTREIGVRIALGARSREVLALVLADAGRVALIGIAAGLLPGTALTFLLAGTLFGVTPGEPVALAATIVILGAAALGAAYLPARRATRVDPAVALRTE